MKYKYTIKAIVKGTDIVADGQVTIRGEAIREDILIIAQQHEERMRGFFGDRVYRVEIEIE